MLAQHLHQLLARHPEFEAMTQSVNVTTFRYVPLDLRPYVGSESVEHYLEELNQDLLTAVERSGVLEDLRMLLSRLGRQADSRRTNL